MPAIWAHSILLVLLVLASQAGPGNFVSGDGPANVAQDGDERTDSLVEDLLEAAYDCRLHYAQLPDSFTRLSLYHLALRGKQDSEQVRDARQLSALMRVIELEPGVNGTEETPQLRLERLSLDPELPFVFFTNGFNHDGALDGTWMRDVASVYFARYLAPADDADASGGAHKRPAGVNVIFLNWHMEGLLANSPLSAILVYYKTMANYEIIVAKFQTVFNQIIEHLDELRSRQNLATSTSSEGRDYFAKFRFFGHSLGSHILAHALAGIHKSRPHLQFGQIHGLDPALPCFLGDQQGLTASKVSGVAREVVIVHSNAGILGAYSDRGQLEIVLNGGTFQPNCSLFDLNCHHARSTQILGYLDDTCKMVAYKCNKYEQFKLGACETCDSPQVTTKNASSSANCVLANLEEQNEDSRLIERIISSSSNRPNSEAAERRVRQLADSDKFSYNFERASSIRLALAKSELDYYLRNAKREYHYVNTNPEFERTPQRSHCLQHYQLRLLTLRPRLSSGAEDVACPLKPMHGNRINLRLFHGSVLPFVDYDGPQASPDRRRRSLARDGNQNLGKFELRTILDNQLHTGLATFGGEPRLFVGAAIDNLDLRSWSKCQAGRQRNATSPSSGPLELVLDVAFMSHTSKSVRHAFSSVLCASWPPTASSQEDSGQLMATNSTSTTSSDEPLMLDLCRQSELTDVSARIDRLIRQVKFQNQFEPWHVILLNSLFSLFAGWEPL